MDRLRLDCIYPITSEVNPTGMGHIGLARLFLDAGIRFFQVRDERMPDGPLLRQLIEINLLCRQRGAQLIVNDRLDLTLVIHAAGVHLGQDDLPVEAARTLGGDRLIIGLSTHSADEFLAAQLLDVDYVAIGPVFESPTKPGRRAPLGLDLVRELVPRKRHPVVAIGGIDLPRARRLWDAGVDSVAVIHDIIGASDPASRIAQYLQAGEE